MEDDVESAVVTITDTDTESGSGLGGLPHAGTSREVCMGVRVGGLFGSATTAKLLRVELLLRAA
jgi:hypothetical protein